MGLNTSQTITLERLALPGSGNYLMAQIPMDNAPGQFYTVEARQRVGYDQLSSWRCGGAAPGRSQPVNRLVLDRF